MGVVALGATAPAGAGADGPTSLAGGATSGSTVSGTVTSAAQDGGLSGQASVVLKQGGTVVDSTYTNSSDEYAFNGVADGSYTVVVRADQHQTSRTSISVAGGDVTEDVTLDARVLNTDSGNSYVSINNAVQNASSGATITVAPGTYSENVDIGTSGITLEATGNASETIIDASSGDDSLLVTGQNVVVEGFTFRNGGAASSVALVNDGITLRDSVIDGNNVIGNGIYTNGQITVENVNITEANNYGIFADSGSTGTEVERSELVRNGVGVIVKDAITLRNNTIDNSDGGAGAGHGVWLTSGSDGTVVVDNEISNNDGGTALQVNQQGGGAVTVTNSVVNNNNIFDNAYGSYVNSNGNQLDARYNWWGASDGPGNQGPGSGQGLNGAIDFDPFRTSANPGTPVIQGSVDSGAEDFTAGNGEVTIQLYAGGSLVDSTTNDASGTYSFRNVSDGSYTVVASAPNHVSASASMSVEGSDVSQDLTLEGIAQNERSGQSFVSPASAIDSGSYDVQAGDTITIYPGTYQTSLDFNSITTASDLTLTSASAASETVIVGQGGTPTINSGSASDGLTIDGLTLRSSGSPVAIINTFSMNTVEVRNSIIQASSGVSGISANEQLTAVDNEIHNGDKTATGIELRDDGGTGSMISENEITGFTNGIEATDSDGLTITYNQIRNNGDGGGNGIGILVGDGTIDGSTITVNWNNVVGNNYGLYAGTTTGTVDAELNWWGDAGGPSAGEGAGGQIDIEPWLTGPAPDGPPTPAQLSLTTADPVPSETGQAGTYAINFTFGQVGNPAGEYVSVDFGSATADLSGVTTGDVSIEGPSGSRTVEAVLTPDGQTLVLDLAAGDVIDDPASGDQFDVTVGNVGNADDGTQTLTLGLHDDSGGSPAAAFVTQSGAYSVQDTTAPTADAGSDFTVDEDTSFTFDGSASSDNGDSLTYEWDTDDDGTYEVTGETGSATYADPGSYAVTLRVTDSGGNTATDVVNVTVNDVTPPNADASNSQTSGDEDTSFTFDGTASTDNVGIDTYEWDFDGDGTVETTGATPSYTYADPGTYTVTLTATDAAGNSGTDTLTVTVNDVTPPNADAGTDFTVDEDTSFTFDGSASSDNGNIASYEWDTDDDGTYQLTGATPLANYADPGTYTVTLRVTDGSGNTATDTLTVTVQDTTAPTADAGPDQTVDEDTSFTFDGSGSSDNVAVTSYEWDFDGDGTTDATGPAPSYTYADPGTYTVTLTATDDAGNTDTDTLTVTVQDTTAPTADAGPDQTVDEDTSVSFDGTGSSDNVGVTTYEWDFDGDGTADATGPTPSYTYADPGIYTVTLTATDDAGNTDTDTLTVTVNDVTAPTAEAGPDQAVSQDTAVDFDGTASSDNVGVTSYEWDFDGDSTTDATGPTPSYTYTAAGSYTVTLTVSDDAGNTDTDTLTVTVNDVTAPTAEAGPDQAVSQDTAVDFDGTASSDNVGVTSYEWDFDGDSTTDATGPTPSYTYTAAGSYTVTLTVSDDAGNTDTDTLTVTVGDTTPPTAEAGPDQTVDEGSTINFDGSSSSDNVGIDSYEWDLDGDGTVDATGTTSSYTYADPGTYTVSLTVSDANGNTDTDTLTVTVEDTIAPSAEAGPNRTVMEETAVSFDGSGSTDNGNIASYEWDVDDDGTVEATGVTPSYTYVNPGTYTVTLTVTDGGGNTDTDTLTVTVDDVTGPTAEAGPDQTVSEDTSVTFDGTASSDNVGITSYEWDVDGDGTYETTGETASHTYADTGTYTVTLRVTDDAGNTDTDTLTVSVVDTTPPTAEAGPDQSVEEGTTVNFDGSSSSDNGVITTYRWDVDGDGTTDATGPTARSTFVDPGTYTVRLTVTDSGGNTDTDTLTITVGDQTAPTAEAGPDRTVEVGSTVSVDGSGSSDDVGIDSYQWNFGDGSAASGVTASQAYDQPGTYTVTLTVTDGAGNTDTDTLTVTVEDRTAPTAEAGPDRTVEVGSTVSVDGSGSSDNVGIDSYQWSFEDGTSAAGETAGHAYDEAGTYTVTLTATDSAGNTDTDTLTVTVESTDDSETATPGDTTTTPGEETTTSGEETTTSDEDTTGSGTTTTEESSGSGSGPGFTATLAVLAVALAALLTHRRQH
ncbi:PKD domain-containing protein [Halapricum salinum]|nr:PKD domain-containing protein [Halapricum salinum]